MTTPSIRYCRFCNRPVIPFDASGTDLYQHVEQYRKNNCHLRVKRGHGLWAKEMTEELLLPRDTYVRPWRSPNPTMTARYKIVGEKP